MGRDYQGINSSIVIGILAILRVKRISNDGETYMSKLFFKKDITYYSLYTLFSSFVFEGSIFVIFLVSRGLTYSETAYLFSFYAVAVIVFEYLTGIFADKYSRRGILILSNVCLITGEICFLIGNRLYVFIIGMLLMALSIASKSGADYAYLYDKLTELEKSDYFDEIISNLGSLALLISAISLVIGSALTKIAIYLPLVGTIIFSILSLLMLLMFKEPSVRNRQQSTADIVKNTIRTSITNKEIMRYFLISVLIFPCYHVLDQLFQPYMNMSGINLEHFGVFYTILTVSQAVGTKISGYLAKLNPKYTLYTSCCIIISGFYLMSIQSKYIVFIISVIMGASFGIYYTVNTIVVNKLINSNIRASILSFQHLLTKIMQTVMFAVLGIFINNSPLGTIFFFFSIVISVLFAIIILFNKTLLLSKREGE